MGAIAYQYALSVQIGTVLAYTVKFVELCRVFGMVAPKFPAIYKEQNRVDSWNSYS
jgi:hypothetical protein